MLGLVYPKMMTNGGPDRVGHNCPTTPLELSSMKSKEKENNQCADIETKFHGLIVPVPDPPYSRVENCEQIPELVTRVTRLKERPLSTYDNTHLHCFCCC